jgi:hypothetical protein
MNDTNLRSHLGRMGRKGQHGWTEYLHPSQLKQKSKRPIDHNLKQELDILAIQCIAEDGRSFGDLNKPGIKKFLQKIMPNYNPPNRQKVAHILKKMYKEKRSRVREMLRTCKYVSITSDLWKSPTNHHFIVLTAHFLTKKFNYRSICIGFRKIAGQHISAKIRLMIQYELQRYNLLHKVVSITIDNGSDIKKACELGDFGIKLSCLAHNLNLVIKNGLKIFDKCEKEQEQDFAADEEDESNIQQEAILSDIDEEDYEDNTWDKSESENENENGTEFEQTDSSDSENEEYCISVDVDEENKDKAAASMNDIMVVLNKCRKLIKCIRKSKNILFHVRQLVENMTNEKIRFELSLDFFVRWNTTYIMIDRFIKYRAIIEEITKFPNKIVGLNGKQVDRLRSLRFKTDEFDTLESLKHCLEPFFRATKILSGSNYASCSLAYVVLKMLKKFLILKTGSEEIDMMKEKLDRKFDFYFEKNISDEQMNLYKVNYILKCLCFLILNLIFFHQRLQLFWTLHLFILLKAARLNQYVSLSSTKVNM